MKKNRTMRVAVLLLALTLITSCFVGGTFAKYTTGDSAADNARVAKWGVEVVADGSDFFKNEYKNPAESAITVHAASDDLVAPGTSGQTTFSISGTPEVATQVLLNVATAKDIFVKAGTYGQYVVANDYNPIKWTLTVDDNGTSVTIAENVSLAVLQTTVTTYMAGATFYAPHETLDATFTLSWSWAFNGQDNAGDTVLGNLAQNPTYYGELAAGTFCTEVAYDFTITVEQVD